MGTLKSVTAENAILACRTGWAGAWDAFIAALLHQPVTRVPTSIHIIVHVQAPDNSLIQIDAIQAKIPLPVIEG